MTKEEKIIKDRNNQYGSYSDFSRQMSEMLTILHKRAINHGKQHPGRISIADVDNFFLVLKMMRKQTANDDDSYIDLFNYSKLIKEARTSNDG